MTQQKPEEKPQEYFRTDRFTWQPEDIIWVDPRAQKNGESLQEGGQQPPEKKLKTYRKPHAKKKANSDASQRSRRRDLV